MYSNDDKAPRCMKSLGKLHNSQQLLISAWKSLTWIGFLLTAFISTGQSYDPKAIVIPYHSSLRQTLANGASTLYDGEAYFKFVIYEGNPADSNSWEPIWSLNPDYIDGLDPARLVPVPEPAAFVKIQVNDGVVSFGLGDTLIQLWSDINTPLTKNSVDVYADRFHAHHFTEGRFFLRVWLSEDGTLFERLDPDVALMGSPIAVRAAIADEVVNGGVSKQSLDASLQSLVSRLETFETYMDQMALVSEIQNDSALTDKGFAVVESFPSEPWREIELSGAPSGRLKASVHWTGSKLLVWGGELSNNGTKIGTGGLLDPAAQTWKSISTVNAPAARTGHAGFWTGTSFLVWGGVGAAEIFTDGAALDPASNLWTPLPDVPGGFESRIDFASAWTGTHLVIWGGRTFGGLISEGWALDPAAETWTQLPAYPGDPAYLASAVWVDGKFVVWGGQTTSGSSNAGYYFTPNPDWSSGSWTAMSASPLTGRSGMVVVVSGAKAIYWGGRSGSSVYDDGAVWNSSDNTWTTIADVGSNLGAAYDAAFAWTGSEALIWGGRSSAGVSGSGAFYNPTSDRWRPAQGNGPAGRHGAAASFSSADQTIWLFGGEPELGGGGSNETWQLPTKKPLYLYKKNP